MIVLLVFFVGGVFLLVLFLEERNAGDEDDKNGNVKRTEKGKKN